MEKTCTKCGESKLLSEYHKNKRGKYGRHAKCKECVKAYMKVIQSIRIGENSLEKIQRNRKIHRNQEKI